MPRDRRFAWLLLGLCAAAGALRVLLLVEELDANPFAAVPWSDAELYWARAGEMAAGHWLGEGPFLIAPLYPYWLGLLRWLGLGLAGVYAVQLGLNLAAGVLVGLGARLRWGSATGLTAAGLFLLLGEAALFATRVLSVTLQVFLVALLWWDWTRLARRADPARSHELRVGIEIGVLTLAFPAALLLVPGYALWLLAGAREWRAGLRRAALGGGAALLAVSPATLHNAITSGEFVPVTAHAGVTLAQGNSPESAGVYTPLDDVSPSIFRQHQDAARVYEAAHGHPGTWREIDAHFRKRVRDWWLSHPVDAALLLASKLRWLATGRRYDNVAVFALEREHGLGRSAAWLPVEIPFLLGAVALGVALLRREPHRAVPDLALLAVPVVVCTVFYYSARYRLVGAPVVCALAGLGLTRWRELAWPRGAVLALALAPLLPLAWNAATGFESLDFMRADYARALAAQHLRAGAVREEAGDPAGAAAHYRRALGIDPSSREAWAHLHDLAVARHDYRAARGALLELLELAPEDQPAHLALAWLLAGCPDTSLRDGAAALHHAREALRLAGDASPEALLVLALAEAESGGFDAAAASARRGADLARARGDASLARDLDRLAETVAARHAISTAPIRLLVAAAS
jgi:hypothetical protein